MKFNREEYAKEYRRISRTNPMTASCPPADDLSCLREFAIEDITFDTIHEAVGNPDLMAELILENEYGQEGFRDMAVKLSVLMNSPSDKTKIDFADSMIEFIEMKASSLAEEEVDA